MNFVVSCFVAAVAVVSSWYCCGYRLTLSSFCIEYFVASLTNENKISSWPCTRCVPRKERMKKDRIHICWHFLADALFDNEKKSGIAPARYVMMTNAKYNDIKYVLKMLF